MKKLLACAVAVLCVVSVAGISFAGGEETPVKAVGTVCACGHDDGECGGQGCCHIHCNNMSHGTPMNQYCGVCGQCHGSTLFDGACFAHNLGCFWKQLNNAGQTIVCCTLGVFKDAMNLWQDDVPNPNPCATNCAPTVYETIEARAETK